MKQQYWYGLLIIAAIVGFSSAIPVSKRIDLKAYKQGYDQAIHDCQQNTFDSDTTITFKPIEK